MKYTIHIIAALTAVLAASDLTANSSLALDNNAVVSERITVSSRVLLAQFRWNESLLEQLGLRVRETSTKSDASPTTLGLKADLAGLEFSLLSRNFEAFQSSDAYSNTHWQLELLGQQLAVKGLALKTIVGADRGLRLVDETGFVWFQIDTAMVFFDQKTNELRLRDADLELTAAAAKRLRAPALAGVALANFSLQAPVEEKLASYRQPANCAIPKWHGLPIDPMQPNGPVFQTDTFLELTKGLQMARCAGCDGPSGADGVVQFVADALVRNGDTPITADVPWHTRFSGSFPPYQNDQHPILVWNLYREQIATGALEQIGRSGAKHAFATINDGCGIYDCNDDQILFRRCGDEYPASTNDVGALLGPRSEVVANQVVWARCGSVNDSDCNGVNDNPIVPDSSYRSLTLESQISEPGYRYFYESWYLIRDDINPYNNMGHRDFQPAWISSISLWATTGANPGPHTQGPMIDRWVSPTAPAANSLSSELVTSNGRIKLATRVTAIGANSWRYQYVLMNVDYVRAQTVEENGPANIRMLSRSAIRGLVLPVTSGSVSATAFRDGTADLADWPAQITASSVRFNAPNAVDELTWGTLNYFEVISSQAPSSGTAKIVVLDGAGQPAELSISSLVPAEFQFANGFE